MREQVPTYTYWFGWKGRNGNCKPFLEKCTFVSSRALFTSWRIPHWPASPWLSLCFRDHLVFSKRYTFAVFSPRQRTVPAAPSFQESLRDSSFPSVVLPSQRELASPAWSQPVPGVALSSPVLENKRKEVQSQDCLLCR